METKLLFANKEGQSHDDGIFPGCSNSQPPADYAVQGMSAELGQGTCEPEAAQLDEDEGRTSDVCEVTDPVELRLSAECKVIPSIPKAAVPVNAVKRTDFSRYLVNPCVLCLSFVVGSRCNV
uniref:Uncharacterized protein n=1 Tax=Branchiostoma floridae TaxID=7739 RepID=C3ZVT9_BRAFL|eukprot:XP_002587343.1 hypothetical protein BRAFLDRAFT_100541 [Branchiostoma floridae]